MRTAFTLLVLALTACSPDLPAGWESAEPLPIVQSGCGRSALDDHDERLELAAKAGAIQLAYKDAHFRCEQEVEGFLKKSGATFEVLVQPRDMDPSGVDKCDGLYDITAELSASAGAATVKLFRRWDDINEPNQPVAIGSAEVAVP